MEEVPREEFPRAEFPFTWVWGVSVCGGMREEGCRDSTQRFCVPVPVSLWIRTWFETYWNLFRNVKRLVKNSKHLVSLRITGVSTTLPKLSSTYGLRDRYVSESSVSPSNNPSNYYLFRFGTDRVQTSQRDKGSSLVTLNLFIGKRVNRPFFGSESLGSTSYQPLTTSTVSLVLEKGRRTPVWNP